MNFEIGQQIVGDIRCRDKFQLEVHYMHGDADVYDSEKWLFENNDNNKLELSYLIEFLDSVLNLGRYDYYDTMKKYCDNLQQDFEFNICYPDEILHGDSTCDGSVYAEIESYSLTYFDNNGIEFAVLIQK